MPDLQAGAKGVMRRASLESGDAVSFHRGHPTSTGDIDALRARLRTRALRSGPHARHAVGRDRAQTDPL